jgi:hypothetical protein
MKGIRGAEVYITPAFNGNLVVQAFETAQKTYPFRSGGTKCGGGRGLAM